MSKRTKKNRKIEKEGLDLIAALNKWLDDQEPLVESNEDQITIPVLRGLDELHIKIGILSPLKWPIRKAQGGGLFKPNNVAKRPLWWKRPNKSITVNGAAIGTRS